MGAETPITGYYNAGAFENVTITEDATTGTSEKSPTPTASTENIFVPDAATTFYCIAVGANAGICQPRISTTNLGGPVTLAPNVIYPFPCAGMGSGAEYPTQFRVTAGTDSPVSWWFGGYKPFTGA